MPSNSVKKRLNEVARPCAVANAAITELTGHLNAATHRWLHLIAEFDRRHGWSDGFTHSCAHWLSWKCGVDLGAAREKVRVARALEGLPLIDAAMADVPLPQARLQPQPPHSQVDLHVSAETSHAPFVDDLPSPSTRRADALVVLAESFLQHGAEALSGGDRHQVVVHVDAESLTARKAGRCELEDGPSLPVETVRRVACDSSIVRIVSDAQGEPLDVGRKTRSIPPALRRALKSRDQGCVFPCCTHQRYVDGHHIHHWADGGATRLSNLVSLCRLHHRAVHEGGMRIERLDDGAWRFIRRNGESLESCAPGRTRPLADLARGSLAQLVAAHHASGLHIDGLTAATRWRGERMDHGLAIDLLVARARKGRSADSQSAALPKRD